MKRYRVTALYEQPPLERTVELCAETAERAMVKALIERRLPAHFARDEKGWYQPVLWRPELAGPRRWPTLVGRDTLVWGEGQGGERRLRFYVVDCGEQG
ncbi:MAG TPA: hypothetical protein ENJ19_03970 [Gammaproteobacteria bacterium]|nr:hypothetical protein [Gammaproteobacteria bacterium]